MMATVKKTIPSKFLKSSKKTVESWKEKAKTQEDNMGKLKKQAEEKLAQ